MERYKVVAGEATARSVLPVGVCCAGGPSERAEELAMGSRRVDGPRESDWVCDANRHGEPSQSLVLRDDRFALEQSAAQDRVGRRRERGDEPSQLIQVAASQVEVSRDSEEPQRSSCLQVCGYGESAVREANGADSVFPGPRLSSDLARLFDAMSDAVCVSDGEGFVFYVNPVFAERFGFIAGMHCNNHVCSLGATTPCPTCPTPREGCTERKEWGDPAHGRTYELSATVVADAGQSPRKVTLIRDITQARRAESDLRAACVAAEAASADKRQDLRTIGHAIRTSLNGVIGYAELLRDSAREPNQRRWAEHIETSGQSLAHLVDRMLETSPIDGEELPNRREPVSLRAIAADVVQLFEPLARAKQIELGASAAKFVPNGVLVDPVCMRQLLTALVHNALKWTERGSVQIRTTIGSCQDPRLGKVCLTVSVSDTGVGMARSRCESIDAFLRAPTSRVPPAEVGLGLALCKKLADRIGGRLELESAEGGGTTVRLHLGAVTASHTNECG